jgi:hypothetical protein
VNRENGRPISFPLRLPFSTRRQAIEIAQREGLSLNQFISLAVAEKITRLEHTMWPEQSNISSVRAAAPGQVVQLVTK